MWHIVLGRSLLGVDQEAEKFRRIDRFRLYRVAIKMLTLENWQKMM